MTFLYSRIYRIKDFILARLLWIIQHIMWIYPIDNNKVVFSSLNGLYYSKEPRKISEELHKVKPNTKIIWILPPNVNCDSYIKQVSPKTFKALFELSTAKIWVDNCRKDYWVKKRKQQYYIQTWHGPICLKMVEKDAESTLHHEYILKAINDSKNVDLMVAETNWRKKNMEEAFWYSGEILEAEFKYHTDTDKKNINDRVKEYFGIDSDVQIVLYAPTFRKDGDISCYNINFERMLTALSKRTDSNWRAIIRLHPNVSEKSDNIKYSDTVLDGTKYPDINELISISDILVSDYSGCIFEGFKQKKIVWLYAVDYDKYIKKDRNVYFKLDELPSPLVKSNDELMELIEKFDVEKYEIQRNQFVKRIGYYEADAAKTVTKIICNKISNN